jgi:hypothetical protein
VPRSTTETDWPLNSRTVLPLLTAVRDTGVPARGAAVLAVLWPDGWEDCRSVPQAATAQAVQTTATMKTRTLTEVRRTGRLEGFRGGPVPAGPGDGCT